MLFRSNFASRIGYRRVLLVTLVGGALAYLPVAAAGSVTTLLACMAIIGIFSGGVMPAANSILSLSSPKDKQGSAFGIVGSANALAFAVSPLLGGIVAAAFGIRAVFIFAAIATLAVAGVAFLTVREPEEQPAEPLPPA